MPSTWFVLIVAVLIVGGVFLLLRDRKLREKYAALWLVIGLVTIALAAFPDLLGWAAHLVGVNVPSNLLFALAILLLLGVTLHLSLEISRLEDETRVLAEEAAMQRAAVRGLLAAHDLSEKGAAGQASGPAVQGQPGEAAEQSAAPSDRQDVPDE